MKWLGLVLSSLSLAFLGMVVYLRFADPGLTEMQLFLRHAWFYIGASALIVASAYAYARWGSP